MESKTHSHWHIIILAPSVTKHHDRTLRVYLSSRIQKRGWHRPHQPRPSRSSSEEVDFFFKVEYHNFTKYLRRSSRRHTMCFRRFKLFPQEYRGIHSSSRYWGNIARWCVYDLSCLKNDSETAAQAKLPRFQTSICLRFLNLYYMPYLKTVKQCIPSFV